MTFDIYGDRAVEAMALIREFARVEYWDYFKGDPERALEAFCVMQDAAGAKSAARIADLKAQVSALKAAGGVPQTNPHYATFPKEIWLQVGDCDASECAPFSELSEITWCQDCIDNMDVRYVRADLAATNVWKSVTNGNPPERGRYLVYQESFPEPVRIANYGTSQKWENGREKGLPADRRISHWMPLPAAPQVAEQTKQQEPK